MKGNLTDPIYFKLILSEHSVITDRVKYQAGLNDCLDLKTHCYLKLGLSNFHSVDLRRSAKFIQNSFNNFQELIDNNSEKLLQVWPKKKHLKI